MLLGKLLNYRMQLQKRGSKISPIVWILAAAGLEEVLTLGLGFECLLVVPQPVKYFPMFREYGKEVDYSIRGRG
jgi:hypothetical protein